MNERKQTKRWPNEPVLASHSETFTNFKNIVTKARLLYDHVEAYPEFKAQVAIFQSLSPKKTTIVYVDDKDFKIKNCDLSNEFDEVGFKSGVVVDEFRPGYVVVGMEVADGTAYGMVAPNGGTVVPTKFFNLINMEKSFILGVNFNSEATDLYDYRGRRRLHSEEDIIYTSNTIKMSGRKRIKLLATTEKGKTEWDRVIKVYAIYCGKLYSVMTHTQKEYEPLMYLEIHKNRMHFNGIVEFVKGKSVKRLRIFTGEQILEMATLYSYGKEPKFVTI